MLEFSTLTLPATIGLIYLAGINLFAFMVYGLDKLYALGGSWRITEKTLLLLALFGGTPGALLGITLFRHKTRKSSFLIWIALIMVIQIGLILAYFSLINGSDFTLDRQETPLLY